MAEKQTDETEPDFGWQCSCLSKWVQAYAQLGLLPIEQE